LVEFILSYDLMIIYRRTEQKNRNKRKYRR